MSDSGIQGLIVTLTLNFCPISVVVYNCTELGSDCSVCRSLKYETSGYECDWCSEACRYSNVSCPGKCAPASVIKVRFGCRTRNPEDVHFVKTHVRHK